MKKILLFVVLLLQLLSFAQKNMPAPVSVAAEDDYKRGLEDEEFQVLVDEKRHLSLKQVLQPENIKLFSSTDDFTFEFVNNSEYWLRFQIKNNTVASLPILLEAEESRNEIYIYDAGKWHFFQNGTDIAWSKRSGDKNNKLIKYVLAPGATIQVYQKQYRNYERPCIYNYEKHIQKAYLTTQMFGADVVVTFGFAGFILFAMVFNLFFYYVNRERLYLVYSTMLFFTALLMGGKVLLSVFFPETAALHMYVLMVVLLGFVVTFINTFSLFFAMRDYFPFWDKVFRYYPGIIGVAGCLLYVLKEHLDFGILMVWISALALLTFVMIGAFMVIFIRTLIKFLRRKDPEARRFIWAIFPYFASWILARFTKINWLDLLGAMWAVVALSWGMFARFKRLQEEYSLQALEKERLTREKEEEKNALIAEQNQRLEQLVEERTAELEDSLEHLKQTQNQLVQSEKMASLGELTAGIAHEIQNPLNFVNNFSDVSVELLEEMEEELHKGDTEEALAIATDVKQNLEKIAHHGRRADSIVKGMLQHSRVSTGQKELTDINALGDEYLRLAYHGLRAKDKTFNAELVTDFDASLGKINVVPQDLGRVFLNMFTNAFYATQQKLKQNPSYKPVVSLTTKKQESVVEIRVRDNGTGIPTDVRDKILQPFFTTKPTGEGTGLGLSLSYDIIVKAHGGTIDIVSEEGEFTEFIIRIPLNL